MTDARRTTVPVAVEILTVETGLWCDACLLSSAVRVHYATTVNGATSLGVRTACEGHQ